MRLLPQSIRGQLLALVTLAMAPVFGLVIYSALSGRREAVSEARTQAAAVASEVIRDQAILVEHARHLLVTLASVPVIAGTDTERCSDFLTDLLRDNPRYTNLGVSAPDGRPRCSAIPVPPDLTSGDRPFFLRARDTRRFSVGEYQVGRVTGRSVVLLGYPLMGPDDDFRGVIYASLDLAWLDDYAEQAVLPPESAILVLDSHGVVLARLPGSERFRGRSDLAEAEIIRTVIGTSDQAVDVVPGLDGITRTYVHQALHTGEQADRAYVAVGITEATVMGPANRDLARDLTILVVVTLLALVGTWVAAERTVIRNVDALVTTSERLAAGNLNARTGLPAHGGELGLLSKAFDSMAAALEDRDRRMAEARQAVEASEEQFRAAFDQVSVGMMLYGLDRRFQRVNERFSEICGYDAEELMMMDVSDITHPDDLSADVAQYERVLSGEIESYTMQKRYVRKDGEVVSIEIAMSPRVEGGEPIQFLGVVTDVTARKKAEMEVEARLREKDVLLQEIHHRVKNNLQVVSSMLYLQSTSVDDAGVRAMFGESRKRISAMALVHETLYQASDLSRVDMAVYLGKLLGGLAVAYGRVAHPLDVQLDVRLDSLDVDQAIPCGIIVGELVTNSLKYAFPSGRDGTVEVVLRESEDGRMRLEVRDDGIGLPEDFDVSSPKTLGIRLVSILSDQLGAEWEMSGEDGTAFAMTFSAPTTSSSPV